MKTEGKMLDTTAPADRVVERSDAPIIYADGCIHGGFTGDVIAATLAADVVGIGPNGLDRTTAITGHLRLSVAAARALRDTIDKALALRERKVTGAKSQ